MAKRPALIPQSDATSFCKAAKAAGYARARLIRHPDGRLEGIADDGDEAIVLSDSSPFEQWKAGNAR